MSEVRALILTFIGLSALTVAVCFALAAFEASGTAWGLALVFLSGFGGVLLSLVVMGYAPPESRRRKVR